ncbi:MAG: family 1 glycosylhydrolase [Ilumatobacteraceae bacterium]
MPDQERTETGIVLDEDRRSYLERHLREVHSAIADGVRIDGYFAWSSSTTSNGPTGTGPGSAWSRWTTTQERRPKHSARWYSTAIANNWP